MTPTTTPWRSWRRSQSRRLPERRHDRDAGDENIGADDGKRVDHDAVQRPQPRRDALHAPEPHRRPGEIRDQEDGGREPADPIELRRHTCPLRSSRTATFPFVAARPMASLGSAPHASNNLTVSTCPKNAARPSGANPSLERASSSAGSFPSHSATRAVRPTEAASKMSSAGSAPSSTATASGLLWYCAIRTGVWPRSL